MTIQEALQKTERDNYSAVCCDPWRLQYHIMPPVGWMNDPNGLCQLHGIYHIFYQYRPIQDKRKIVCWGHYTTRDFVTFTRRPIAVYPDSAMDSDGAYSGSAIVTGDVAHFFYTGNILFDGTYDYVYAGRGQYVNHFSTTDGETFTAKENLLRNCDYPSDMSCHVRDPQITEHQGAYTMVLGGRTRQDVGCALFYTSADLEKWEYAGRAVTRQPFGYMWESPNLVKMGDKTLLLVCPQGVEKQGYRFENVHQSGYFVLPPEMTGKVVLDSFTELDHGFDFYSPQVFTDEKGRTILIGWMGMPDDPYENPTKASGWENALTLPRQLWWEKDRLFQYPIEETKALRRGCQTYELKAGGSIDLGTRVFEAQIEVTGEEFTLTLRKDAELRYADGLLTLRLGESGYGRKERHAEIPAIHKLSIFSDNSCLEVFVNGGEYVLTTRLYDHRADTRLHMDVPAKVEAYTLAGYVIRDESDSGEGKSDLKFG